jgi:hypothetical protein
MPTLTLDDDELRALWDLNRCDVPASISAFAKAKRTCWPHV